MAYMVFLCFYTYVVLVRLPPTPHWTEYYVIAYISTLMLEKFRQVISKEPHDLMQKLEVWAENRWNVSDSVCGLMFLVGLVLRLQVRVRDAGRVIYCTNIIYWYLKILEILSSDKYLGPLVMMMGKMIKQMAYFVILLLVVLMSFGVCRQAILNPDEEPHWRLARHIFFQVGLWWGGVVVEWGCGGVGLWCGCGGCGCGGMGLWCGRNEAGVEL
ncbi:Ion transport domain [Trinorchestia longiramus]|nr:Ion transport domain [Trinorchestia longiramus]